MEKAKGSRGANGKKGFFFVFQRQNNLKIQGGFFKPLGKIMQEVKTKKKHKKILSVFHPWGKIRIKKKNKILSPD